MKLDDYEDGKGSPRSSSEYLVPKAVREKLLKEHACVSRRDMAATVRTIQKEKAKRRKTVTNLNLSGAEEVLENVRRNIKTILKPNSTYTAREAQLWDEAHIVAMEKAKRLEESIHRGESVRAMDFYKVGTILCNSNSNSNSGGGENGARRNTAPVVGSSGPTLLSSSSVNGGDDGCDADNGSNIPRRNTAPILGTSALMDGKDDGDGGGGGDVDGEEDIGVEVEVVGHDDINHRDKVGVVTEQEVDPLQTTSALDHLEGPPQSQQQQQLFDNDVLVKVATTSTTTTTTPTAKLKSAEGAGGGYRRGSHASIVAMENDDEEDDVLAQLNLDDMNVSTN